MDTKLDGLDFRIINFLHENGRITITDLAEKVKSSRPTVTNRLKRLIADEVITVHGGLNLGKFGFKMACVGLEVKNENTRMQVEEILKGCPRVLNFSRTPEKANIHINLWGEDDQTINSMIESYRDYPNIDVIYTHYLGTPVHGNISINLCSSCGSEPPCGKNSAECHRYLNGWCRGCPASEVYKNPLL